MIIINIIRLIQINSNEVDLKCKSWLANWYENYTSFICNFIYLIHDKNSLILFIKRGFDQIEKKIIFNKWQQMKFYPNCYTFVCTLCFVSWIIILIE